MLASQEGLYSMELVIICGSGVHPAYYQVGTGSCFHGLWSSPIMSIQCQG